MEICPLDDRYKEKISTLLPIFSSVSYTKYRVFIEFVYFIELLRFASQYSIGLLTDSPTAFNPAK